MVTTPSKGLSFSSTFFLFFLLLCVALGDEGEVFKEQHVPLGLLLQAVGKKIFGQRGPLPFSSSSSRLHSTVFQEARVWPFPSSFARRREGGKAAALPARALSFCPLRNVWPISFKPGDLPRTPQPQIHVHHHTGSPATGVMAASSSPLVPTAVELLRLAHGTLRQASPEKAGNGGGDAEAAAALRSHLHHDKALRQDLRSLAALLQEAMLQEEGDEDDASSSSTSLCASFSEALSLAESNNAGGGSKKAATTDKRCSPSVDGAGRFDPLPHCTAPPRCDPMMSPSLLTEIVDYLGLVPLPPSSSSSSSSPSSSSDMAAIKAARATLGNVASVCRLWKEVACRDRYWKRLTGAFLPLLTEAVDEKPKGEHCRQVLVRYARCLSLPAVRDGDDWQANLELSFEIVDAHDGARLFSAR